MIALTLRRLEARLPLVARRKHTMNWALKRGVLRKLRLERGWTQGMVAAKSGMSVRQVKAHESSRPPKSIRNDYLIALIEVFKQTGPKHIADFDGPPEVTPSVLSASSSRKPSNEATAFELEQTI